MHRWFFSVLFSVALFIVVLPSAAGAQPTTPTLTTEATASATLGEPISDTATLSGATSDATGTITFNVYGPDDADCSGEPAFTSVVDVNGNGDYSSDLTPNDPAGDFVPSVVGTYRWTADYSGDVNNAAVSSECNAENEQSVVTDDDGGGGGGGNNDNDNNRNDNNRNDNDNNRNNNNRGLARGVTDRQYGGNLDIGDLGLGDNPGFGAGQDTNIPDDVIADTIPEGELPFTGGPPLFGLAIIGLACAGLGVALLRGALRHTRDR